MSVKAKFSAGLTPSQLMAIESLARGVTATRAAAVAEVDRATVYRWLNDFEFCAELQRTRQEIFVGVRGEMRALAGNALGAMRELIESSETAPSVRFKAALTILKIAME